MTREKTRVFRPPLNFLLAPVFHSLSLSAVDALWSAVVGAASSEAVFRMADGVDVLLQLLGTFEYRTLDNNIDYRLSFLLFIITCQRKIWKHLSQLF